ncbi:MAG: nucleotidyl transferase AbiEii/AbiGii toxin family protein [Solirubrobacteraceae bacterium]
MPAPDKPRHRSGYTTEETAQVRAMCLTVAVTLGAYLDDVCIVGGLVPPLLIDIARTDDGDDDLHPGTNDLDLGLALALLDDERYAEINRRLRSEGFEPDTNENGNPTVQRWRLGELKVTIDFLMPPAPDQNLALRVQNLQPDFGALVTPGLELAFDERVDIELDGHTLAGERARRIVPVCGPAAFVVLKALAFGDRGEPKDAYDLVYVIRHAPGRGTAIAERLRLHADRHAEIVARALGLLTRDFDAPEGLGPLRAAAFAVADDAELEDAAADAHGFVDDLLRASASLGLNPTDV